MLVVIGAEEGGVGQGVEVVLVLVTVVLTVDVLTLVTVAVLITVVGTTRTTVAVVVDVLTLVTVAVLVTVVGTTRTTVAVVVTGGLVTVTVLVLVTVGTGTVGHSEGVGVGHSGHPGHEGPEKTKFMYKSYTQKSLGLIIECGTNDAKEAHSYVSGVMLSKPINLQLKSPSGSATLQPPKIEKRVVKTIYRVSLLSHTRYSCSDGGASSSNIDSINL